MSMTSSPVLCMSWVNRRAVREKLIDELGGISDALAWLYREIER